MCRDGRDQARKTPRDFTMNKQDKQNETVIGWRPGPWFLLDAWTRNVTGTGLKSEPSKPVSMCELRESEWSNTFENLMRNRLVMGALRYGRIGASGKPKYNRPADCIARMKAYIETGNLEHLVDVANLCLLEFVEGDHPARHFSAADDGTHTTIKGTIK